MEERDDEAAGVPDMTMMPHITEQAINDNLRRRYKYDLVYTYTGSILVAVNPYKELGCYGMDTMLEYRGKAFGTLPPHVFALAESAYSSLTNGEKNQSVVISGESGAGKTETTKLILQYLCAAGGQASWAEQQILEANTVLEAFGNAKTVRNDNSSRFGKFVEVRLDGRGGIRGAVLRHFLLERARITEPAPRETNYHVFYQLLEGTKHNKELRSTLRLRDDVQYKYLRPEDEEARKGRGGEQGKLEALQLALTVLQVPPQMCEGLFKVLAAVLWLGNIQFQDVDGERTALAPSDTEAVEAAAALLGLAPATARRVLLERQINVRGNVTDIPLRLHEARENRHAMARALYSRTFSWLVRHVNSCSAPGRDATRALGVLDIFGFENFASNSLEQLCINYANEKLHMFFNNYVFALEQEIYQQEGIVYNPIPFTDNAVCLELLEKPPRSLLKLLSEQCHMPKGSDGAYLTNIQGEFGEHTSFVKGSRRRWEEQFGVRHYAGDVTYSVQGFVDKNRDTQQDAFIDHLSRSQNPFVRELADYVTELSPPGQDCTLSSPNSMGTTQRGTSKGRPTVVDTFRAQLQSLVDMLQATHVWYVRCIKPNENKEAGKFNADLVLEQLRYLGMNEIVRIRRDGFPVHLPREHFLQRYRCALPAACKEPDISAIMAVVGAPATDWQVGHTKVFMRSSVHAPLEARRNHLLQTSALRIQKWYKGTKQRAQYLQHRNAAILLQAACRGWKQRVQFLRLRRAALTLQRHLRGAFAREVAAALREMRRVNDEMKLREERNSLAEKASQERAELETMADQLRGLPPPTTARQDSVNLDNLFDFLSDVPTQRGAPDGESDAPQPTIAEIGDDMERLVDDLDNELENVLGEMNEMSKSHTEEQRKPDGAPSDNPPPSPPTTLPLQSVIIPSPPLPSSMNGSFTNGMTGSITLPSPLTNGSSSMSSSLILPPPPPPAEPCERSPTFPPPPPLPPSSGLPEPVGPPPPPPGIVKETTPPELTNGIIPNGKLVVLNGKEPIYESVIPRPEAKEKDATPPLSPPPPPVFPAENNGFLQKVKEQLDDLNDEPLPPIPTAALASQKRESLTPAQKPPPLQMAPPAPAQPMDTCMSPPPGAEAPSSERTVRRKERVERRLQQMEAASPPASAAPPTPADAPNDLAEFAKLYFNDHPRSPEGTIIATLTRKSKSMELLTKEEMVVYHKGNNIPTSHIQLHDPDSVSAAVSIFRDLCRYMRGELTQDKETHVIQSLIGKGLEREELRDEILVQCVRQITECPVEEWAERVWLILCLCAVAWQPSRGLARYYCAWLRSRTKGGVAARATHCAQWCLDNCRGAAPRQLPPSTVEIAAMRRLGTIVCRFFFLDGRTKAIDVHPADTAAAAAARLADKLGLSAQARAGWAVYQQRGGKEEHVRATHYLYDVIAAWEMQQGPGGGSADNRFVFKRRLFRGGRDLPHDPVEVSLLYAQAVHSVVKLDEFPVSEKVALQLGGLQAQVSLGEPSPHPPPPHTRAYYAQPEQFLPPRVARTRPNHQWATILAQAHRQYGAGRAELTAKALYLSCVMQYPLYGVTLFPVTYKGYWAHGPNVLLGVGSEGVVLVRPTDKVVLAEYPYSNIAALLMDPVDNGLTISLTHHGQHDGLRCIVLESPQKNEAAWLMAAYSPILANGLADEPPRRAAPASERSRLAGALKSARRALVDSGMLRRPSEMHTGNFLRNTLRRLSKTRIEKVHIDSCNSRAGEVYKGFPPHYWGWARTLPHSLTRLNDAEEVAAMQIFKDIMSHAGLSTSEGRTTNLANNNSVSSGGSGGAEDGDDRTALAQALLQRCLQKDSLLAELYVQLIKQTTDHPDPSSRVSARHWALLCAAVGAALPPVKPIRRLLLAHLRYRGTALHTGEEGKFARRAEQVALSIAQVPRRLSAPSKEELLCASARRPMHMRVLLLDGKQHGLVFGPAATADHLVTMLREKIGLSESATGYALYEVCANSSPAGSGERALAGHERIGDVLARWEKAGATAAACRLVFKKRLFLGDRPLQTRCAAEMELLYYQVLHAVRHDRLPIDTDEAVMLAALHAQVVGGDCAGGGEECAGAAAAVLPARLALPAPAVRLHHLALRGTPPPAAMQRALTLASSWPLTRATIFDVMQSFTSNWPRFLWLAVDAHGLTLHGRGSRAALVSHELSALQAVSPAPRALLLVTSAGAKHAKLVLSTDQAYQIATLIKDYIEAVRGPVSPAVCAPGGAGGAGGEARAPAPA
ncbi:myosin-I heavy chain [Plutella xylostella]|uniref:myosin-I heavy chain n=1 Tax=Plutella xylostella TaxID=51655 RepID=UPI0020325BC1|nr:myosin-I heavy chain [Plutella xylostella]